MTVRPPSAPLAADSSQFLSGWRYRAVMWSVLCAALGYLAFALWSGWKEVISATERVGVSGIAIALMLSSANYGLRFMRWQAYLRAMDHPVPWWPSLKIYLAGFALTTTPGKAGETLRGIPLKRWGVPYTKSFAAFFSERLSDLVAIVLLTLIGLSLYPTVLPFIEIAASGIVLVLAVVSNQRMLGFIQRHVARIPFLGHVVEIILQARRCYSPGLLVLTTCLSSMAWLAEAWAFYLILQWMGLDVPLRFAVFVYAISMLVGALSFMPGGLGGAEAVMAGLLVWAGVGAANAVAATLLTRLATLWFAVLIGALVLAQLQNQRKQKITEDEK